MRNFDDRAERLKVVPHGYKKIVDVCGSKWPSRRAAVEAPDGAWENRAP